MIEVTKEELEKEIRDTVARRMYHSDWREFNVWRLETSKKTGKQYWNCSVNCTGKHNQDAMYAIDDLIKKYGGQRWASTWIPQKPRGEYMSTTFYLGDYVYADEDR